MRDAPELAGREMLVWGDILDLHPDDLDALPGEVTVCEWWYDAGRDWEAIVRPHAQAGRSFWVCPGTSSWTTTRPTLPGSISSARSRRS